MQPRRRARANPRRAVAPGARRSTRLTFGPVGDGFDGLCGCWHGGKPCSNEVNFALDGFFCDFCHCESALASENACHCDCPGCSMPRFERCARPGCPCTASWNGEADEYCCLTCRDGMACERNYHHKPFASG